MAETRRLEAESQQLIEAKAAKTIFKVLVGWKVRKEFLVKRQAATKIQVHLIVCSCDSKICSNIFVISPICLNNSAKLFLTDTLLSIWMDYFVSLHLKYIIDIISHCRDMILAVTKYALYKFLNFNKNRQVKLSFL